MTGTYVITAEVNLKEGRYYEEDNDADTAEDNNMGTLTLTVGKEPKEDADDEWYQEIYKDIEDEPMYLGGIIGAVVVVVVIVALLLVRRRGREEYEEEGEEEEA